MADLMKVHHDFVIELEGLTDEQFIRLQHHLLVSRRVFEASAWSMVKGVKKYGPEPTLESDWGNTSRVEQFWLPHIFSEAVDGANQIGLFADALGVVLSTNVEQTAFLTCDGCGYDRKVPSDRVCPSCRGM